MTDTPLLSHNYIANAENLQNLANALAARASGLNTETALFAIAAALWTLAAESTAIGNIATAVRALERKEWET